MPSKNIIAGISFNEDSSLLAVLERTGDTAELLFLDEYKRNSDREEFWYLNPILSFLREHRTRIHEINVALDGRDLVLLHCLLDNALTQAERNEHVHWELSHYIDNYQPKEYVNDVHLLETRPQEQVEHVLAVAVRRHVIFGLQDFLSKQKLTLGVVDVNHFATENALIRSHPETGKTTCACIGAHASRLDVSILNNGHMVDYRYSNRSDADSARSFLTDFFSRFSLAGVYIHGTGLSRGLETTIKSLVQGPVTILNPFRRIIISQSFRTFDRYLKETHRFAAAVGIALRKS